MRSLMNRKSRRHGFCNGCAFLGVSVFPSRLRMHASLEGCFYLWCNAAECDLPSRRSLAVQKVFAVVAARQLPACML
eukprot:1757015-Amphidinium_carterae.1